ncbi:MAG: hypothetical protein HY885_16925 [Deltaproteobacteria bacterium]|nr:hypothetical protein [Deltaproteobacteria bacterium]
MATGVSFASMTGLSVEELTDGSDAVVQGKVERLMPRWSDDGKKIITTAYIRVSEVVRGTNLYKGGQGALMQVEYEGGEIGDIGYKRADVSALTLSDEVFVFVKAGSIDQGQEPRSQQDRLGKKAVGLEVAHTIVGLGQGIYKVDSDGMARKNDFSIIAGHEKVQSSLPVKQLKDIVKGVK